MSLMDSIDVQYVWKAIQESERSDENLYPNATLSDWLTQASQSKLELEPVNNTSAQSHREATDCSRLSQSQMLLPRPKGGPVDG